MIVWQGPVPIAEKLGLSARLYGKVLAFSMLILASTWIWNIGSWVIWRADAEVIRYPVFLTWLFFYLALLQLLIDRPGYPPAPGRLALLGIGAINFPIAVLTTIFLQTPVLFVQVSIAKFITSMFS